MTSQEDNQKKKCGQLNFNKFIKTSEDFGTNIQFGIDKLLNNARVGVIMRIMKAVQIWGVSGELITGGAMGKETFLDFIKNNAGVDLLEDAEILWEEATQFSLSDYLDTIKVSVQEI